MNSLKNIWSQFIKFIKFDKNLISQISNDRYETANALIMEAKLQENDMLCEMKSQPDFPVIELRVDGQSYVFNSLYRVWMIESIFSNVLEDQYKTDPVDESEG